jgi:hypothetical protein
MPFLLFMAVYKKLILSFLTPFSFLTPLQNLTLLLSRLGQMLSGSESEWIPQEYRNSVRAVLAGHIHLALGTTRTRYTQVGAISQGGAVSNSFFATHITKSNKDINVRAFSADEGTPLLAF